MISKSVVVPFSLESDSAGSPRSPIGIVEELYGEHYDSLYRYLILSGCQPADADDLIQSGFVRLLWFLQQGNRLEKPKAWLIRVVHNLRIDDARRERRESTLDDGQLEACITEVFGTMPDVETELLQSERRLALQKAVGSLTPRQYEFLLLRAAGLKLREIAEIHQVTIQTVAEICARATERLGRMIHG
ncbi:MAG: sigma-70 family RNA polymerase sigma factor [Bryobacterales bacterium]|nr:sigma-70 family RNA polymerase sigma factor [Bryobacterales bacterium]